MKALVYKNVTSKIKIKKVTKQPKNDNFKILNDNQNVLKMGCYHILYRLDAELIAVGVVDITPQSLSTVYFFYDPKYRKFSLGVVSAIYELKYILSKQRYFPHFKYYYLGYYIQSSKKMVYKGDYMPCELLCPITYQWVELTKLIRKKIGEGRRTNKKGDINYPKLTKKGVKVIPDMSFAQKNQKHWDNHLANNLKLHK